MSFKEVRLDMKKSLTKVRVGFTYKTSIIELPSGQEFRRGWWSTGRKKWRIKKELLSRSDVKALEVFLEL